MGTILAKSLITRTAKSLNDVQGVRWTPGDLLDYLNAAQREIGIYRPDAITVVEALALILGAQQSLPAGGVRFVDALNNAGNNGLVAGPSVRMLDREELDVVAGANWRGSTAANDVENVIFDGRYPTYFYVYPPNTGGRYLNVAYQKTPVDCTVNGVNGAVVDTAIALNDIYESALLDYMLHKAYLKDTEARDNSKAAQFYQWFLNRLGLKTQADKAQDANRNAAPAEDSRRTGGASARAKSF